MTSDDAIKYLEEIRNSYDCSYEKEALDMAISAMQTIGLIKSSSGFTNHQKAVIAEMLRESETKYE